MVSRSGGTPIRTNKVRSGPDQAFTLPKGTSAAPIKGKGMGVPKVNINKKYKKEIAKLQKVLDKSSKVKSKVLKKPKKKDLDLGAAITGFGIAGGATASILGTKAKKKKIKKEAQKKMDKKKKVKTSPGAR